MARFYLCSPSSACEVKKTAAVKEHGRRCVDDTISARDIQLRRLPCSFDQSRLLEAKKIKSCNLFQNSVEFSVARDAAGNFETIAVGHAPGFHGKIDCEREADHNQHEERKPA